MGTELAEDRRTGATTLSQVLSEKKARAGRRGGQKGQRVISEKGLRESRQPAILGKNIPDGGTNCAKSLSRMVTGAK